MLRLGVVIGAVNVFFATIVAAVTLLLALTASYATIDVNGRQSAVSQTRSAAHRADAVFAAPAAAASGVGAIPLRLMDDAMPSASVSYNSSWTLDASDASRGLMVAMVRDGLIAAQAAVDFKWLWTHAAFFDGSVVVAFYQKSVLAVGATVSAVPLSDGSRPNSARLFDPPDGAIRKNIGFRERLVIDALEMKADLPDMRNRTMRDELANRFPDGISLNYAYFENPMLLHYDDTDMLVTSCVGRLRSRSAIIGFTAVLVELQQLGDLLQAARFTLGTHVFAVDGSGYLIASTTVDSHFMHVRDFKDGDLVANGCTNTQHSASNFVSSKRRTACRDHVTRSGVMGGILAGITTRHPELLADALAQTNAGTVGFVRDNDHFATAMQPPSLIGPTKSLRVVIILVVPRDDLLGDAREILPRVAGFTAAVVLVLALASFAVVWCLLLPLGPIAIRMGRVARLEDDEPPASRPWLREVSDLQTAFGEMAAELTRIRSFVPQHLLFVSDSGGSEDDSEYSSSPNVPAKRVASMLLSEARHCSTGGHSDSGVVSVVYSGRSSNVDSRSGSCPVETQHASFCYVNPQRSSATETSRQSAGVQGIQSRTAEGIRVERVSILALNLRRFHSASGSSCLCRGAQRILDPTAITETVKCVLEVTRREKGVIDSFMGDRFLISFNAARVAAGHPQKAARSAGHLAGLLPNCGLRLQPTMGVASGYAHVGNVGCAALKRFTVVGPVVAQAVTLERLCKLHSSGPIEPGALEASPVPVPGICLVPESLFADLGTVVSLRTVDLLRLPGKEIPQLVASVDAVLETADADNNEWMYILAQHEEAHGQDGSSGRQRLLNRAWEMLISGNVNQSVSLTEQALAVRDFGERSSCLAPGIVAAAQRLAEATLGVRQLPEAATAPSSLILGAAARRLGEFYATAIVS